MHTFLSLDINLIPVLTEENEPTLTGRLSNDNSRMLIDGYNEKRELVHPQSTIDLWFKEVANKEEAQAQLIEQAIEYTTDEIIEEFSNPSSIWYKAEESLQ